MATAPVQMQFRYKLRSMGNKFGDVHFIAYNHPIVMLRWGAAHRNQIPLFRQHAAAGTILPFQLAWEGNVLWDSPVFRAQITHAPDEQGQFELTVLDNVDLSGLNTARR